MTPQQHHRKAAKIHEQASSHHNEAANNHESGNIVAAALHTQLAYEYEAQAIEHRDLLNSPSYMEVQANQALVEPLQGASGEVVGGPMMRTLNIL